MEPGRRSDFLQRGFEMITLILVVCLSATPDICREERPPIDVANPIQCMTQGEIVAAQWLEEHPKWQLAGLRCQVTRGDKAA
jgi:hypothetical protein